MDGFLFCFACLFICFCAWHALQVRGSRVLVSTLTNRGPQAGAGIQLGHRHCLATCWFLCGSLCVATAGQLRTYAVQIPFYACFTLWADMLSLLAGLVLYMCFFWNACLPSLWRCQQYDSWSLCISGCFQSCSLGRVLLVLLPGHGLGVSVPSKSARVLLPRGLPFRWGPSRNPSFCLAVELK